MNRQEVGIELVEYRTEDIEYASAKFVSNFAIYSGIMGTEQWVESLFRLRQIISNQEPHAYVLPAEGLEIEFSGFKSPTPRIVEGGVLYVAPEPRFVMNSLFRGRMVLPSLRTKIERVVTDISHEMSDVYHLKIDSNPPTLIFPKEEYARSINVYSAQVIN